MNLEGLTEKRNHKGTIYYEDSSGVIVAKVCGGICGNVKSLDDYVKKKAGLGDKESTCKTCSAERRRKWYEANKERHAKSCRNWRQKNSARNVENNQNWYENNKLRKMETDRVWRLNNPDKVTLKHARRRAREAALPYTLTIEEYAVTLEYFGNACALTGRTDVNLEQEHALPISIGHGGTTFENCYPMAHGLNQSKFNHNIFEWFEANRQRFNLEQWRFERLIEWLASANAMSVEEYRAYVYECHANPNEIDDDLAI